MGTRREFAILMAGSEANLNKRQSEMVGYAMRMVSKLDFMVETAKKNKETKIEMTVEMVGAICELSGALIGMAHHNDLVDANQVSQTLEEEDAAEEAKELAEMAGIDVDSDQGEALLKAFRMLDSVITQMAEDRHRESGPNVDLANVTPVGGVQ